MSVDAFIAALQGLGPWAFPVCLCVMVVCAIIPVPAELPALVNGAVLGVVGGSVVTWLGAMIGAVVSYELGDVLQQRFGTRLFSERSRQRLAAIGQESTAAELVVLRFTPVVAFHLLNYVAGVSRVPRRRFLLTTAFGILPGAVAFTGAGSAFGGWMVAPEVKWGVVVALALLIGWRVTRHRTRAR